VLGTEALFQRIQGTGSDITEYNADRGDDKHRERCLMVTAAARDTHGLHDGGLRKFRVTDRQDTFLMVLNSGF
jgi:hypothetical protein